LSDVDKTKEAILEIFKRDDTTAPEALFLMSAMAARMIASQCSSPRQMQKMIEDYVRDIVDAVDVTVRCECDDCRKALN
jgi:hypothetical protein